MRNTLWVLGTAVFIASFLVIKPVYATPVDAPVPSDREIDARIHDLDQSLRSEKTDAEYWEYGWGTFDAGTMVWSAVQASGDDNRKDRNTDIIQASESLIGLADVVFRPLPAFHADSVCRDPLLTRQARLQCLETREALLKDSSERAHEPYEILPHLGNFGFNLLAGLLVWKTADTRHALITAIPGEIIGEIQLETTPRQPIADFDRYTLQFGPLLQQAEGSRTPAAGLMATLKF